MNLYDKKAGKGRPFENIENNKNYTITADSV
jgi:hypothetical protein